MDKIPLLFERDTKTHRVMPKINPDCMWVLAGEGFPTVKIDGMNVKVTFDTRDNNRVPIMWKRQKLKEVSGKYYYVPAKVGDAADAPLFEALANLTSPVEGYYEAYGPKIQGNPQFVDKHYMIRTAPVSSDLMLTGPHNKILRGSHITVGRLYDSIEEELGDGCTVEGIVFHKEVAGKLVQAAKVRRKDFGFVWPLLEAEYKAYDKEIHIPVVY